MLLDAFMTQRQLAKRGRPVRAQMHRLTGRAKLAVGVVLAIEIASVFFAATAHSTGVFWAGVAGLVFCHVTSYFIESRPGNLKPRRVRQA